MFAWKRLVSALTVLCTFVSWPAATQCDTSYYEKFYSARRFVPLKRTSLVECNFAVKLVDESLAPFEQVALVGDINQLGAWRAEHAVLMNRTAEHNVWTAAVNLSANASVNYRYFIAAVDKETRTVLVRRWETHIHARSFSLTTHPSNRSDVFGVVGEQAAGNREVQRGWLNAGRIVQFKLFRNPLRINETLADSVQLRLKLQPVEPQYLTPILPSARAYSEVVRMVYGDSFLREQPEFGVQFGEDDILIFHTTLTHLEQVAYLLKVYATTEGSELVRLIGYQYIYPEVLQGSEGSFTVNLLSPTWLNAMGSLDVQYLVINPMPNSSVDFRTSFVDYWRDSWTGLDVGHRGLGKSLKQATNVAPIIENTVASMIASGELGADMVEFDVQLTSDLVPIIYHDYYIYVCIASKTPTSIDDLTQVLIKDVTYEQLKNLKTYQVVSNKIVEYPAHNAVEAEDLRLFPLFEDFLKKVNKTVGFDIEIKWPQLKNNGEYDSIQTIDKNVYVDRILEVMLQHGCGRLSFFTAFDADICTLLRFKQNMYPVMFLSSSVVANFADPRSDTIYQSVSNAQAFDLAGIVPNAIFIQGDPTLVEVATKQNVKVFLWGDVIKDTASIAWFKEQGPVGVIYDRLDLWLPANKTNVFELAADLPQFFDLQCTPASGGSNSTGDNSLSTISFL